MRAPWIEKRRGQPNVSQMHFARAGVVTEEMAHVALRERLAPELVRSEVARGRMFIPANINHPELQPMAIGIASSCKVNANIGNSQVLSEPAANRRARALPEVRRRYGDGLIDRRDIPNIRNALLRHSTVPLGRCRCTRRSSGSSTSSP